MRPAFGGVKVRNGFIAPDNVAVFGYNDIMLKFGNVLFDKINAAQRCRRIAVLRYLDVIIKSEFVFLLEINSLRCCNNIVAFIDSDIIKQGKRLVV